jgi:hypothetical protein
MPQPHLAVAEDVELGVPGSQPAISPDFWWGSATQVWTYGIAEVRACSIGGTAACIYVIGQNMHIPVMSCNWTEHAYSAECNPNDITGISMFCPITYIHNHIYAISPTSIRNQPYMYTQSALVRLMPQTHLAIAEDVELRVPD